MEENISNELVDLAKKISEHDSWLHLAAQDSLQEEKDELKCSSGI